MIFIVYWLQGQGKQPQESPFYIITFSYVIFVMPDQNRITKISL